MKIEDIPQLLENHAIQKFKPELDIIFRPGWVWFKIKATTIIHYDWNTELKTETFPELQGIFLHFLDNAYNRFITKNELEAKDTS